MYTFVGFFFFLATKLPIRATKSTWIDKVFILFKIKLTSNIILHYFGLLKKKFFLVETERELRVQAQLDTISLDALRGGDDDLVDPFADSVSKFAVGS